MLLIKLNAPNRTTDSTANQIKSKKYKLLPFPSEKFCKTLNVTDRIEIMSIL